MQRTWAYVKEKSWNKRLEDMFSISFFQLVEEDYDQWESDRYTVKLTAKLIFSTRSEMKGRWCEGARACFLRFLFQGMINRKARSRPDQSVSKVA